MKEFHYKTCTIFSIANYSNLFIQIYEHMKQTKIPSCLTILQISLLVGKDEQTKESPFPQMMRLSAILLF